MISEEKIQIMTQAALAEERNRKDKRPAVNFFPEDYVGFQVIKGVIGVTLVYIFFVVCWGLYTADTWMVSYTLPQLINLAQRLILLYVLIAVLSAIILILVYSLRYYQARTMVKEEEYHLRRLHKYYDNEDRKHGD